MAGHAQDFEHARQLSAALHIRPAARLNFHCHIANWEKDECVFFVSTGTDYG